MTNEMDKVKKVMEEIVNISTENDYVSFEVLEAKVITQEKEYSGVSVKFIGCIKQVRIPFSIDLGVDDVIVPEAALRSLKTRLPDFEEPKVYTYSLESTIAEKFDAILKRMEGTSRMKDFFDIYYLSNIFEFDLVLNRLQQFLEPIFDAFIHDKEFFLKWSVDHGIWEKID